MNLHEHARLHLHRVLECASRYGDRFPPHYCGIALRIGLFIDAVLIQIGTKIHSLAVKLREGRRDLHRKTHDLIGHEFFFEGCARFRTIVDDADTIATVETIRRTMVAWIAIVIDGDCHALEGFCAGDRGHIGEKFMFDCLERPFSNLAAVTPFVTNLIGKIIHGLGDDTGLFRCKSR